MPDSTLQPESKKKTELAGDDVLFLSPADEASPAEKPETSSRKPVTAAASSVKSVESSLKPKPPAPTKAAAPKNKTGNTKKGTASTTSIKNALQALSGEALPPQEQFSPEDQVREPQPEEAINTEGEDKTINPQELLKFWKEYAESIQQKAPRIFPALNNNDPQYNAETNVVKVLFRNNALIDEFKANFKSKVLSFLRGKLQNSALEMQELLLDMEEAPQTKFYTDNDKLRHMIEKNPALQKLRQDLKLDFD